MNSDDDNNDTVRKELRAYIHLTCSLLVDRAQSVRVDYVIGARTTVFEIHSENLGAILGKNGLTISALRQIIKCASSKYRLRCVIEIIENN